jgi:hypothetical protein
MIDNIKLPIPPKPDTHHFDIDRATDVWSHSQAQMLDYARAAVEADRAQRAPDTDDYWAEPDEERLAMEAVMESLDPATWPGLTVAQRCTLGRFAKPQLSESAESDVERGESVGADDFRGCAIGDSNYAAGMLLGWNLCVDDNEAAFNRIREDRLRAAAQASRPPAHPLTDEQAHGIGVEND